MTSKNTWRYSSRRYMRITWRTSTRIIGWARSQRWVPPKSPYRAKSFNQVEINKRSLTKLMVGGQTLKGSQCLATGWMKWRVKIFHSHRRQRPKGLQVPRRSYLTPTSILIQITSHLWKLEHRWVYVGWSQTLCRMWYLVRPVEWLVQAMKML